MDSIISQQIDIQEITPSFSLGGFAVIMLASFLGAFAAVWVLPNWIPGMSQSLNIADPKVFWYVSRGSAFVAYFLLWISMVMGVGITNKMAAIWPGLPSTIDLHQYTSILGLAFGIFHGMILLGDHYINFTVAKVLVPFASAGYKPIAVGVGQLGFYLWAIIALSFYIRKKIGSKTWRVIHFGSFASFLFALLHGISSGTDTATNWGRTIYWVTGVILLYLVIYRVLHARDIKAEKKARLANIPPRLPVN